MVREDKTIRPFHDESVCLYHKKTGFKPGESVYVDQCKPTNARYQWHFDKVTGLIANDQYFEDNAHCLTVASPEKLAKQSLKLYPCNSTDVGQQFYVDNGLIKMKDNERICVNWVMRHRSRLWMATCVENFFGKIEPEEDEPEVTTIPMETSMELSTNPPVLCLDNTDMFGCDLAHSCRK